MVPSPSTDHAHYASKQYQAQGLEGIWLLYPLTVFISAGTNVFEEILEQGLEPTLRLAVAERIAAITMFCKRASIYKGLSKPKAEDVTLSDMVGGTESINGVTVSVTEAALLDVLGCGLFAGGIGERHVWRHWTYAEFLAARYLFRHKLSIDQIGDLIFTSIKLDEETVESFHSLRDSLMVSRYG
jgi:hypothetical protein